MVKQATKGQKEIYAENKSTISWYLGASVASLVLYFAGCHLMWECNSTSWIFFGLTVVIQAVALLFMKSMAASRFDERGNVVDAGMDLNDPSAFGEYCKDALILSVITQVIALYTNYGYLLLLAFPAAVGYKFTFSFLLPWLSAPSESDENAGDDKRMKKRERKEKVVYRR